MEADLVIAGPGDLYTTILPLLLARDIQKCLKKTHAKTVFVVNTANKPFETPHYQASEYLAAIQKHLHLFPFQSVLVNTNTKPAIPEKLRYSYVPIDRVNMRAYNCEVIAADLVDEKFPLYHDPAKTARKLIALL